MKGVVDLYRPRGDPVGAVALIHGGFWRAMYGREGLDAHCRDPAPQLVVTVSGCNDLAHADELNLGDGAVRAFTGGSDAARRAADPMQRLPLRVRTVVVVPDSDPPHQKALSTNYVEAARAAGGDVVLDEVPGDHLSLLDTGSEVWAAVVARSALSEPAVACVAERLEVVAVELVDDRREFRVVHRRDRQRVG